MGVGLGLGLGVAVGVGVGDAVGTTAAGDADGLFSVDTGLDEGGGGL